MRIVIIGTGYVGLVTGTCFSEMGHEVVCLDIDQNKIALLKEGQIPFYEPGLSEMVLRNQAAGRLSFTNSYSSALKGAKACFLALPTPSHEDGSCNLSYLFAALDEAITHAEGEIVLVNKSTAPVGTAQKIHDRITEKQRELNRSFAFEVVSNPEFLKEGSAVADCLKPDRIVIGTSSEKAKKLLRELYAPFSINRNRILFTDLRSAEMIKYASNAMLALRISFMNELATLCELVGADINEVRSGVGTDSRIGPHFLYAGIGFGGSCFPKDISALKMLGKEMGYAMPILEAVETVNARQKKLLSKKIHSYFEKRGGVKGKTIAIWGLSFKPDTDDMREAPSLEIIRDLIARGAKLRLYDPIAIPNAQKNLFSHADIQWCKDEYEAAHGANAIALVTEWKQFRFVNFEKILEGLQERVFFDGRNQYKKEEMHSLGFSYFGIGLPHADE